MRVAATPPFTTAAITAFAGCRRVRRVVQRHLERVCVEQSPLTISSGGLKRACERSRAGHAVLCHAPQDPVALSERFLRMTPWIKLVGPVREQCEHA
jgi:hypothetical protein